MEGVKLPVSDVAAKSCSWLVYAVIWRMLQEVKLRVDAPEARNFSLMV